MFQEVGLLVARGEMSVAQEHTLSATVRNHLGTILENLKMRPSSGHKIVFATQEGELHEFGILIAAIAGVAGAAVFALKRIKQGREILKSIQEVHNGLTETIAAVDAKAQDCSLRLDTLKLKGHF